MRRVGVGADPGEEPVLTRREPSVCPGASSTRGGGGGDVAWTGPTPCAYDEARGGDQERPGQEALRGVAR